MLTSICLLPAKNSAISWILEKYTGSPGLQKNKEKFTKVGNENYTKEAETIDTDILKLRPQVRFEIIEKWVKGPNSLVVRSTIVCVWGWWWASQAWSYGQYCNLGCNCRKICRVYISRDKWKYNSSAVFFGLHKHYARWSGNQIRQIMSGYIVWSYKYHMLLRCAGILWSMHLILSWCAITTGEKIFIQ
jgi:hypothetical protein